MAVNVLAGVRRLKSAGIEARQAEAIVETIHEAVTEGTVTKGDLKADQAELRADMQEGFANCKAYMREGFASCKAYMRENFATKADLYRALLLVVIGQTALIVGLLKLLP